jgi:hypothetical protein
MHRYYAKGVSFKKRQRSEARLTKVRGVSQNGIEQVVKIAV